MIPQRQTQKNEDVSNPESLFGLGHIAALERRRLFMQTCRRPENMERINTPALAQAFIDEQIKEIK